MLLVVNSRQDRHFAKIALPKIIKRPAELADRSV